MKLRRHCALIIFAVFLITLYLSTYPDANHPELKLQINRYSIKELTVGYKTNNTVHNNSICTSIRNDFEIDKSRYSTSYPEDGTCYFRDTLRLPGLPDLHSVFSDPIGKYVAFIGSKLSADTWNSRTFNCAFPDGEIVENDLILQDNVSFGYLPQYIVVITCKLPEQYQKRSNFQIDFRILPNSISVDNVTEENSTHSSGETTAYNNLTVCRANTARKRFLAICTMVKQVDEFIPTWLLYYKYMGVDHVYIYDNADRGGDSSMNSTLREFIDSGFVTVIPWAHTQSLKKTYLEVQIAHENDCLWRHRHHVLWMIKIDVDEYIQPMDPSKPKIIDYLKDPKLYSLGGVRIQNWFFGRPRTVSVPDGNIIERNVWRSEMPTLSNTGHDKNILRPMNVHYFKIHAIKLGGGLKSLNPFTEMRLVHYRGDNPRYLNFRLPKICVKDTSMEQIWKSVLEEAKRENYEDLNQTSVGLSL